MTGRTRYTKLTANEILPDVIRHLGALREASRESQEQQTDAVRQAPTNGGTPDPRAWAEVSEAMGREMKWFADRNIQVKSLRDGLIDFPAEIGGETVLLCWKEGEASVAHWHTLRDGFPGRKPL